MCGALCRLSHVPSLNLLFSLLQNEAVVGKDQRKEQQTGGCFGTVPGWWLAMRMVRSPSVIHKSWPFSYHRCLQCFTTCPVQDWALVLIHFLQPRSGDSHRFGQGGQTRFISPGWARAPAGLAAPRQSLTWISSLLACVVLPRRVQRSVGPGCGGNSRGLGLNLVIPPVPRLDDL